MSTQPSTKNTQLRQTGIIKHFNNAKGKGGGFGFIAVPGERDMFVHARQVRGASDSDRQLFPGDEVSFEIGHGPDGRPCAENVIVQLRGEEFNGGHRTMHRHD